MAGGIAAQSVVPIPAAAWLFASAFGVLGWAKAREVSRVTGASGFRIARMRR
jgi:hypothetical protein